MNYKNILYVCRYAAPYSGNFIPSIAQLADKVVGNHDVYFLFPEESREKHWLRELPVSSDHILFCSFHPIDMYKFCRALSRKLGREQTIVHTHFMGGPSLFSVNLCFRRIMNHYHMFVPPVKSWKDRLRRTIAMFNYRNNIVIAVSNTLTAPLQKYLPWSTVVSIPNCEDFAHLTAGAAHSTRLDFLEDDAFNILIHGSHFYWKGVDYTARVVEKMNEQGYRCRLYITSGDVGFTESQLHSVITHREYFQVIKGVEGVKNLYDNVDLMLSASRFDALSYAIMEASYSECQVAATDIRGNNMLKDIPGIRWIESENEADLENAILEAMEAKRNGTVLAIKQLQREYVLTHYNVDIWVDQVIALYQKHFGIMQ